MLLLWEQGICYVVAVGAGYTGCCCCGSKAYEMMLWEPGSKVVCCGSKAKKKLLLWEQGKEDVAAVGASFRRCYCCGNCIVENRTGGAVAVVFWTSYNQDL